MPQRHTIHRQIVEVTVASAATAERISSVVSDLIRNAVTPLLERMFDEMTPRAEIVRLDRLELDLGRLDLASLQRELPARIAAKLPAALLQSATLARRSGDGSSKMAARDGRTKPDADAAALLVIGHFVTTGTLPWWCDGRGRDLLDRAAEAALQRSPASLAHSLRGFVSDPTAMNRLIGHLSDQTLDKIGAALAPDRAAVLRELAALLESTSIADLTPRQRRLVVWRGLLQAACAGAQSDLIETALTATAVAAGVPLASLVVACTAAASARAPSPGVAARLAALMDASTNLAPAGAARRREPRLSSSDPALTALHAELAPLAARLPGPEHRAWSAAFERLAQAASGRARDD
ncbi:MAG: contractile injection system tape measure protein, partial [Bradyrhizobium sp.]